MRKVKDAMNKIVKTIEPSATMADAAKKMKKNRIGCLVVVDGNRPVGMITERDLAFKVIAEEKSLQTRVEEVMSRDLKTIDKERTLKDAAKIMAAHLIRRLPVVEEGVLIGILTLDDIIRVEKIGVDSQNYQFS
jgi:CBS domain-containing protein